MEFDKVVNERHSVRNFKETKKPKDKDIISAIEAATKSPLAGNLPAIKYILVSDKKKINELANAAQQNFISKVHYVVVVCSDKNFLQKYYSGRAEKYAKQQAGAAIENFLLKITELGLASCWIGAFSDETVKRILGIPDDVDAEALLPVGYEFQENKKVKRLPKPNLGEALYFNKYKNEFMMQIRKPEYQ